MTPFIPDGEQLPLDRFALIVRMLKAKRAVADIADAAGVTEARILAMVPLAGKPPKVRPTRRRR